MVVVIKHYSLVLLILQYSCQVWLPHYHKDISILKLVQRWAVRWMCNSKLNPSCYSWTPSTDICIFRLGWPSIMNHFTASCLLFLFDLLHNKFTMSFNDYFQFNTFHQVSFFDITLYEVAIVPAAGCNFTELRIVPALLFCTWVSSQVVGLGAHGRLYTVALLVAPCDDKYVT